MSDLQRAWAKSKLGLVSEPSAELEEEGGDEHVPELPEYVDDDSSSASSVSSAGTIIPNPGQKLFARPQGYVSLMPKSHFHPFPSLLPRYPSPQIVCFCRRFPQ